MSTTTLDELGRTGLSVPPREDGTGSEEPKAKEYPCPVEGCDFVGVSPQQLGAHKRNVHRGGKTKDQAARRTRTRRPPREKNIEPLDTRAVLKLVFPNGIPASMETINRVVAWLEEGVSLHNLS